MSVKSIYDGNILDKCNYRSYKFINVESCGVHVDSKHITKRAEGREDYHLLYVESGEMLCLVNGRRERICEGGYVLYPPHAPQEYEQSFGICFWVHFSGACAEEIVADSGLLAAPLFVGGRVSDAALSAFERMIYRYITDGHSNDLALSSELLALLSTFKYIAGDKGEEAVDGRLCKVVSHMHKHYTEDIELEKYAHMAYVGKDRFVHLFKETMGTSPYAYVLNIRMERAAELLALSEDSVAEIATKVGFKDALHFSKTFKKAYGISPKVFRTEKNKKVTRRAKSTGCD